MSIRREHWIASVWGIAEATLFFFVPDVFLSWAALAKPKRALVACAFALAGALAGGTVMYFWGAGNPATVHAALDAVPAIRPDMIATVRADLEEHGPIALFAGPPRGVPYKIYAAQWGVLGGSLAGFLLMSVPARGLRFLLAVAIAGLLRRRLSLRAGRVVHLSVWFVFYAWYFYVMRG